MYKKVLDTFMKISKLSILSIAGILWFYADNSP